VGLRLRAAPGIGAALTAVSLARRPIARHAGRWMFGASNELGEFESGLTASWWGPVPAVVVGGSACLGVVGLYLRMFPELRRLDRFPDPARD
jgi:hypothetical protein